MTSSESRTPFPVTQETVERAHDFIFSPWVKQLGLCDFVVETGRVCARLPWSDHLKFSMGTMCGQALMAAIDTVAGLAMATARATRGTAYQHTHFLRPAMAKDFLIEATVLRFGRTTAYCEAKITDRAGGALIAHAVLEFALY